jgi:hypothetical protein
MYVQREPLEPADKIIQLNLARIFLKNYNHDFLSFIILRACALFRLRPNSQLLYFPAGEIQKKGFAVLSPQSPNLSKSRVSQQTHGDFVLFAANAALP